MESEFENSSTRMGKGIIAIAMGVGLIFVALKYGHFVSKEYVETPCLLKQVSFGINSKGYDVATQFDYEFEGKAYTSETFTDQKNITSSGDVREASAAERAFWADKKYRCFVMKEDPTKAHLVKPVFGFYLKWGVLAFGLFMLLTGVGYIFQVLTDNFVPGARALLGLFFSMSMFMAALIASYFLYPYLLQALDSGNWKKANAVVHHLSYDVSKDTEGKKSYDVKILYNYRYKGKDYRSIQYNFLNSYSSDKEDAIEKGKKYPKGKQFKCYVDPDNPEYSVIEKETFVVYLLSFAVFAMYVVAFLSINGWGVRIQLK